MNLERGVAKMPEIAECGNARDCRMRKCQRRQYNGECGNARIQWRRIQYNGEAEMPEKTIQCGSYAKHAAIAGSLESQFNPWKCKKSLKWKKRKAI